MDDGDGDGRKNAKTRVQYIICGNQHQNTHCESGCRAEDRTIPYDTVHHCLLFAILKHYCTVHQTALLNQAEQGSKYTPYKYIHLTSIAPSIFGVELARRKFFPTWMHAWRFTVIYIFHRLRLDAESIFNRSNQPTAQRKNIQVLE